VITDITKSTAEGIVYGLYEVHNFFIINPTMDRACFLDSERETSSVIGGNKAEVGTRDRVKVKFKVNKDMYNNKTRLNYFAPSNAVHGYAPTAGCCFIVEDLFRPCQGSELSRCARAK
jgi:hypothetical protein